MTNGGINYESSILVYQRTHTHNFSIPKEVYKEQQLAHFKQMVATQLKAFQQIPHASPEQQQYFRASYMLWSATPYEKLNRKLFKSLRKNRNNIFRYRISASAFFAFKAQHPVFYK